jgi:hypothetical protein
MPLDPGIIASAMANWQQPADPLATYAKLQALRNGIQQQQIGQQQLQSGALDLQQKQQTINAQRALDDAMKSAYTVGADGSLSLNKEAVASHLAQTGNGHMLPSVLKSFDDMDKAATDLKDAKIKTATAQNDYIANTLSGIADSNFDPKIAVATVAHAQATGALPAPQALQITAAIQQNPTPEGVKAVIQPFMAQSPAYQKLVNERETAQAAVTSAGARKSQADVAGDKLSDERIERALNAAAGATNQAELDAARNQALKTGASPAQVNAIPMQFDPAAMAAYTRSRLNPEQRTTADQRAAAEAATEADRKVTQAQNARRIAIEGQNAGLNAQKFAMEFGGDAVKGWAKQIADNPDTANQVPPALRTSVMQRFTADTGLPYPKPLAGTAVDQERASRNALDAVAQIKTALQDPEVKNNIGPIMGRLANAEQRAGTAIGLSPSAEAKAQQLRTNMRYLLLTEAKAQMGGRVPQQVLQALEQSSPNVKMDADMLQGAMAGVSDASNRNLDQTYKQRFGENAARPGSAASAAAPAPLPNGGGKLIDKATAKRFYDAAGGDPAKTRALIKQNNWTLQ